VSVGSSAAVIASNRKGMTWLPSISGGAQLSATRKSESFTDPASGVVDHLSDHTDRQRRHQAVPPCLRQEGGRCEQALERVLPPDQRLDSQHGLGRCVDLGLVPDDELTFADAATQILRSAKPLVDDAVLRHLIQRASHPRRLGLVHGHVGAAQEVG